MTTTPSNTHHQLPAQLKIPTFNTSTFRLAQLAPDRTGGGSSIGIPTINTTTTSGKGTKKQPIRLNAPPTALSSHGSTTTSITTTKISVDGKVIDIDVLTKLQQKNGGNIVSFTASKELLSNLAANKLTAVSKVSSQVNHRHHQQNPAVGNNKPTKAIAVAVYGGGAPGVSHFNPRAAVKTSNEKFLLPKTKVQTVQYPLHNKVEVKKFAPEINGLLSGLRAGGGSGSTSKTTGIANTDIKSIKAYTMKNQAVAISFIGGDIKNSKGSTTMFLPAAAPKTHSSSAPHKTTNTTTVKTIVHNHQKSHQQQHQYLVGGKAAWKYGSNNTNNKPGRVHHLQPTPPKQGGFINNTKHIRTTQHYSAPAHHYNNTTRMSYTPTSAIVENKTYRANKNILENNRKSSFKIQTLLLQDALKKETMTRDKSGGGGGGGGEVIKNEDSKDSLDGFEKLYEDAVNNVLNIKVFPEDLDSKKSKQTLKEIQAEFKQYLETPMDIEAKINDGVFKYSKKRSSPTLQEAPEKKPKLISSEQLNKYLQADTPFSTTPTSLFNRPASTGSIDTQNVSRPDNQNFFSQFLTDQTKLPKPFNTPPSFFSPMDYPWLYPSYMYAPKFYASSQPPPLVPHPPPPTLKSTPTPTGEEQQKKVKEEKGDTIPHNDEKKTRTRSVTNSLPNKNKNFKQNAKENKNEKQNNKQTSKTTSSTKTKKNKEITRKEETNNKRTLAVKNETSCQINNINDKDRIKTTNISDAERRAVAMAMSASEKRLRNKDNLKFRYSLRQRAKALKIAKKLAKLRGESVPKLILKKLDKKSSTKKELFLANFGLRRILKRIQNPPPPLVQDQ